MGLHYLASCAQPRACGINVANLARHFFCGSGLAALLRFYYFRVAFFDHRFRSPHSL